MEARRQCKVPYFRPSIGAEEIDEVVDTLRSGWLTTGPKARRFEDDFAAAVGARYAVALTSCTAALHLAVDALQLQPGQAVLVPTMTFAATAEVIRYRGAIPVLVDCDPGTLNVSLEDAERKILQLHRHELPFRVSSDTQVVGFIPVHVGGLMADVDTLKAFAKRHGLWLVEDAAHAFPAAWRRGPGTPWQRCGNGTAAVTCYSFYANKTITTGEGGMAVTDDADLAAAIRRMSLHGLSRDAWGRYSGGGSWDYQILAPGYKYNLTDIAAAIGLRQLARAEEMRRRREEIAFAYLEGLRGLDALDLPPVVDDRIHAWHLFPLKLKLEQLGVDRNVFIEELRRYGVSASVHWRPLHLHPYYYETFGWKPGDCGVATAVWRRLVSLPIFADMSRDEIRHVIRSVESMCRRHGRAAGRDSANGRSGGIARRGVVR